MGKRKHGHARAKQNSKTYKIWTGMRRRCTDPKNPSFKYYGGRGLSVCPEWNDSFAAFLKDMGECPDGHSIERADNDKGYEPGNCSWAPLCNQSKNRKTVRQIDVNGVSMCIADWARKSGLPVSTISRRLATGWPAEQAVGCPPIRVRRGVKRNEPHHDKAWAIQQTIRKDKET